MLLDLNQALQFTLERRARVRRGRRAGHAQLERLLTQVPLAKANGLQSARDGPILPDVRRFRRYAILPEAVKNVERAAVIIKHVVLKRQHKPTHRYRV